MRTNKLRQLLKANQPSLGTRLQSPWPFSVEIVGHTGIFDYVEFEAEYSPFSLDSMENFCRAAELYQMSTIIKVDQEPRGFLAQRGIGAGFQNVLFADCRSPADVEQCVYSVRPDTPMDRGSYGAAFRRFAGMGEAGIEFIEALREVFVMIMVEKRALVDQLEEALSIPGVDMIVWGPADFSMSIGRWGERNAPEILATRRQVIETANQMGIPVRAEIDHLDQARQYLDLGVRHFSLGLDSSILFQWLRSSGDQMRKLLETI